jgi:hypothetical protein
MRAKGIHNASNAFICLGQFLVTAILIITCVTSFKQVLWTMLLTK